MRINNNHSPFKLNIQDNIILVFCLMLISFSQIFGQIKDTVNNNFARLRISINEGWKFYKYTTANADSLIYDVRPEIREKTDNRPADARPTEAETITAKQMVLKPWILPTGNDFLNDTSRHYIRPEGKPGSNFAFVSNEFEDNLWENVNLPHDWAIKGPFIKDRDDEIGGSMGRLPSPGVAWYRKKLYIPKSDSGKSIFLDVDGAMSYAMVWFNGNLVGGWPYGYASWSLNLTPYIIPGSENQLAIRLDNPPASSRWYPGGGIYRNVWLTKTNPVHIGQWGTFITAHNVSKTSAKVDLKITINNDSDKDETIRVVTQIFLLNDGFYKSNDPLITLDPITTTIVAGTKTKIESSALIENPKLWGPPPTQIPNLYLALTNVYQNGKTIDQYETRFGIRSLRFDPDSGVFINNELIKLKGVNQHHDLGALGAAFNKRPAERQLEILKEMGCNSIRMSHNPPVPELLELTDRMGFLVMDEAFDVWIRKKTPLDFHLIFPDWYEQDLRAMIRRDKNCPSVVMWSFGNEVGEQYTGDEGAAIATKLNNIIKDEDSTRSTTCAMNWAKPYMPFSGVPDVISLNYQGEGIRQDSMFEGSDRIRTAPMYDSFHIKFPGKVILSSETASAASSRGIYLFPVVPGISSPIRDGRGGDSKINQVSSYELYAVDFGSSPDKVFSTIDQHPFVAGEFVWNGFDYLGEPTPYYEARSSYTGIIDLAGFKKDRFFLYQSHWKPELPMAHILPHWNWPERVGKITPVHVFTSGDEAELFLNGESLGRKKKGQFEYRLRWDEVKYQPGELKVVAYKNGNKWAEDVDTTTDEPAMLEALADRNEISADGKDLSFITVRVTDKNGLTVPVADNSIKFTIKGPGKIIATDNGDPTNLVPFPSHERRAFSGLVLVIVRSNKGSSGQIIVGAESQGLKGTQVIIKSR